ncbi:pyridoxal-dependent decarboxylase, exosortase A system-associated [Aliikangiella coralliicola]|uniref:Pyridoxal-dependent decarboxylase, exosortase A system-associated n=2 Tax=Aliikangiella coralliicola TaxID=2592383 RepID=A0A545UHZ6_9GAMM|nr:pyridoxal-dependent decarboxylase, exosortase A system-associated [Aliikangiella coralliicola]
MSQFQCNGDQLLVNGHPLNLLKYHAGQTPFYAYDRSVIAQKVRLLRHKLPTALKLHYAVKANPMPAVVNFMREQVDGLDVASGNELRTALNSGLDGHQISFAGPGKQSQELGMAVATQTTVNVESFNELEKLRNISDEIGVRARVAVRVNPNFELKSSGMKMGGGAQQFGVDAEQVPEMLQLISEYGLHYRGLHIFTGSQNLNEDSILTAHRGIFELATQLQQGAKSDIESLNIGGGLGIPYFPGETPIHLEAIGEQLNELMTQFSDQHGDCEIAMELGRYLVGDAGIYVCEVIDIKQSRGTEFIVVNGGLHQHLSASGNFGQVIRKNYPVAIGNKMQQAPEKPVQIVGPLCTPLDLLANKYKLPKVEIGDLVVIYQSGAYGYSASPRDFLSHPHPVEILI